MNNEESEDHVFGHSEWNASGVSENLCYGQSPYNENSHEQEFGGSSSLFFDGRLQVNGFSFVLGFPFSFLFVTAFALRNKGICTKHYWKESSERSGRKERVQFRKIFRK